MIAQKIPLTGVSRASWFHQNGVRVFPIVEGSKEPAVRWKDFRCSAASAARFQSYGVHLENLIVIDADTEHSLAWVYANIPDTPFRVATGPLHDGRPGRGIHRYFRSPRPLPHFIHRDGLAIESRNGNQYVLGPGSRHPSGVWYDAAAWSWKWEDIPVFPDSFCFDDREGARNETSRSEPFSCPTSIDAGERHDVLFRQIRAWKHIVDVTEARRALSLVNEACCKPPLKEDADFERWFMRAWNLPDREQQTFATSSQAFDARTLRQLGLRL